MSEVVASFNRRHEAEYAQGFLTDAEIPSSIVADDAGGADLGLGLSSSARIAVGERDRERALQVLRDAGVLDGS